MTISVADAMRTVLQCQGRLASCRVLILSSIITVICTTGCRPQAATTSQLLAGRTMGTTYSITIDPNHRSSLGEINDRVQRELELVNQQMSTYVEDSELSRFNSNGDDQWFAVSRETAGVVALSREIWEQTNGAFDVTVGPLVNLWGFGPGGVPESIPSSEEIEEARRVVGSHLLQVRQEPPALRKTEPKLQVDLSAIAKGHGVDRVARILDDFGVESYFVEIGGEVRVRGSRPGGGPWRAGIESPREDVRDVIAVLPLQDQSLATSGNYRNFYDRQGQRYSHTIDPRTGYPVRSSLVAVSVVADNCALADGLATSMMSLGLKDGLRLANEHGWAVWFIVVDDDQQSAGGEHSQPFRFVKSEAFERLFPELEALTASPAEASSTQDPQPPAGGSEAKRERAD